MEIYAQAGGSIRGVCPRGLIEATGRWSRAARPFSGASAGSAPAASLKLAGEESSNSLQGRIRGVCPRGLIEAAPGPPLRPSTTCIRGVCPRGLIEAPQLQPLELHQIDSASAGSAPAASLKRCALVPRRRAYRPGIRGVCPRGLIEARRRRAAATTLARASAGSAPAASLKQEPALASGAGARLGASAGSAPAASLKRVYGLHMGGGGTGIRGVCPRGLIEARGRPEASTGPPASIRGVCPRGLIEAMRRVWNWARAAAGMHPRGLPPRPH